jgi:spore germination protein YaaH
MHCFVQIESGFRDAVEYTAPATIVPFQFNSGSMNRNSLSIRMQRWRALLLVAAVLLFAGRDVRSETLHYQIWGYYPYWMQDEWRKVDLGLYDRVLFFEIPVVSGGAVVEPNGWPVNWDELIVSAQKNGVKIQPTFTMFDAREFERIFSNEAQRTLLEVEMLALLDRVDCSGLQLDFEFFEAVSKTSSNGFHGFLKSLKQVLASKKKSLSLFVLTEDSAGLYDKTSLSYPDYLVIQGYDAHWKGGANAGSVAQLHGNSVDSWDSSLKYYLSLAVPRSKILMSVPYFGYEWPTVSDAPEALTRGVGREISYAPLPAGLVSEVASSALERIGQYGLRRDPATGSPYYAYQDATGWHQGWFEDDASLSAKFEFVKQQQLAGIAVFSLGYDGGNFQRLLRQHFR